MIEKVASLGADLEQPIEIGTRDTPPLGEDLVGIVAIRHRPVAVEMRGKAPVAGKGDVREVVVDPAVVGNADETREVEPKVANGGAVAGLLDTWLEQAEP